MPPTPIRVVVADAHPLIRTGIRAALDGRPDIITIAETETIAETLRACGSQQSDVLLLGTVLRDGPGAAVLMSLATDRLVVRTIAVTAAEDVAACEMIECGAVGVVLAHEAPNVLPQAVVAVATGRTWFSTELLRLLVQRRSAADPDRLTPREHEVLVLMAAGQRNVDIARRLKLSTRTVEFHVHNTLAKLGATSRYEAIRQAYRRHLLDPDLLFGPSPDPATDDSHSVPRGAAPDVPTQPTDGSPMETTR